jgi:hypothetical protein
MLPGFRIPGAAVPSVWAESIQTHILRCLPQHLQERPARRRSVPCWPGLGAVPFPRVCSIRSRRAKVPLPPIEPKSFSICPEQSR